MSEIDLDVRLYSSTLGFPVCDYLMMLEPRRHEWLILLKAGNYHRATLLCQDRVHKVHCPAARCSDILAGFEYLVMTDQAGMTGGYGTNPLEQALAGQWHSVSLPPLWVHFLCQQIGSDTEKPAQSSCDPSENQTFQPNIQPLHYWLNGSDSP